MTMPPQERVWVDCKHGRWLSPCPICAEEKKIAEQGLIKFKREHFIRIDIDKEHYYYSFGVPGFEICLEPCAGGFDVAIYDNGIKVNPGVCTNSDGYLNSAAALFGDRTDEDWNKALTIADDLFDNYSNTVVRDKFESIVPRVLIALERTGMKCMFCGCTDDHACPGGCSWVELNVCSRCKDRLHGNDLISGEEIKALRTRAKTITMKDGLRIRMQGGVVPVIPMDIKSGYGVSLTIIDNPPDRKPLELFSVGARHGLPDPADSESIATAVLGKGYAPLPSLRPSSKMVHFFKRRE